MKSRQIDIERGLEFFMKYNVNLRETEEGYVVWIPGLPGCRSQGQTEEEALENAKDAISAYLEAVGEWKLFSRC